MTLFAQLISLQIQREETLISTQNQLMNERETSELREQFIAVLGHDLRNPLGSILTGVEVLLHHGQPPQSLKVLERIRRSANRISGLVNDVVDFTRGRMGGGISLNMRHETELSQAFHQVVDELKGMYPEREIVARISPNLKMLCDAGRLGQLLSNLLKNALVHGDASAPVDVCVGQGNGILEVSVTNKGETIPPDVLGKLFQPFWRAAPTAKSDGLGLGLYIVSEIARSHRGELAVASAGNITTFTFSIKGPEFIERRVSTRASISL